MQFSDDSHFEAADSRLVQLLSASARGAVTVPLPVNKSSDFVPHSHRRRLVPGECMSASHQADAASYAKLEIGIDKISWRNHRVRRWRICLQQLVAGYKNAARFGGQQGP